MNYDDWKTTPPEDAGKVYRVTTTVVLEVTVEVKVDPWEGLFDEQKNPDGLTDGELESIAEKDGDEIATKMISEAIRDAYPKWARRHEGVDVELTEARPERIVEVKS
jgi:hypothetical protein